MYTKPVEKRFEQFHSKLQTINRNLTKIFFNAPCPRGKKLRQLMWLRQKNRVKKNLSSFPPSNIKGLFLSTGTFTHSQFSVNSNLLLPTEFLIFQSIKTCLESGEKLQETRVCTSFIYVSWNKIQQVIPALCYNPPPSFSLGGDTPLYGLYRYVRPQMVWFFSRFGHK